MLFSLYTAIIYVVMILICLLAVAFLTVFERKFLAAVQRRRGPNAVGYWGMLQGAADGVKLIFKRSFFTSGANFIIFLMAPVFLLTFSLSFWIYIPLNAGTYSLASFNWGFLFFLLISSANLYCIVLAGYSSNSRYALIGGVRAIAQMISYEIPLSLVIATGAILIESFNICAMGSVEHPFVVFMYLPLLLIFFVIMLAETNRTPFDLPEAEAELVAGYNVEYSSLMFALFFLAEYNNIIIMSVVIALLFFGGNSLSAAFMYLIVCTILGAFVIARAALPRFTFLQLMALCWRVLIPATMMYFVAVLNLLYFWGRRKSIISLSDKKGVDDNFFSDVDRLYANAHLIRFDFSGDWWETTKHLLAKLGINYKGVILFFVVYALASGISRYFPAAVSLMDDDLIDLYWGVVLDDLGETMKYVFIVGPTDAEIAIAAMLVSFIATIVVTSPIQVAVLQWFPYGVNLFGSEGTEQLILIIVGLLITYTAAFSAYFGAMYTPVVWKCCLVYWDAKNPSLEGNRLYFVLDRLQNFGDYYVGDYKILLSFIIVAWFFIMFLLLLNWLFFTLSGNMRKGSAFECGYEPLGSPMVDFEPNFCVISIMFIVFDVELVLLIPFIQNFSMMTSPYAVSLFLLILMLGYIHEVNAGVFDFVEGTPTSIKR